ncbi:Heparinase II/III N-terminus [Arachidicoccus rhizosphaerae]|uniref:Heparinase II/III N-terminus n=1 Tax=Arachidicoccus rhizosphaerae TaxID=551991 RepID=A0A1H4CNI3_9BACT|nr:alginate lyase family protein [Arachidicoccus rhizosphaerae]SEA62021.1 Heparinase II/III N-terminus [Arachidicoccus rhizosphaerae]
MLNKVHIVARVLRTLRFLKFKQIQYQIIYRLSKAKDLSAYNGKYDESRITLLDFSVQPPVYKTVLDADRNHFVFLNLEKKFDKSIEWGFDEFGKLWNYNLQYCHFVFQEDISKSKKESWLSDLYFLLDDGQLELESYPASLRSINVIRLINREPSIFNDNLLRYLHAELDFLSNRLEYHLLANHLLENLFALLMGGAFFGEIKWINKATRLLKAQLEEQILPDGGHFELSPMYHQIILFRLLELIDWYKEWPDGDEVFEYYLRDKAERMVSWLKQISFVNGEIPYFNDSTSGISFSTDWLLDYSAKLGIILRADFQLRESGYRVYNTVNYECRVDVGQIGASYQPGHAHADTLSFVLNVAGRPFLIDPGISTYIKGRQRLLERSTHMHNTVVVDGINSSEVYGAFRVGRRAIACDVEEYLTPGIAHLSAYHNGYLFKGIKHKRAWEFSENLILIHDIVESSKESEARVNLIFSHEIGTRILKINDVLYFDNLKIEFSENLGIALIEIDCPIGYNLFEKAIKAEVIFKKELLTKIELKR